MHQPAALAFCWREVLCFILFCFLYIDDDDDDDDERCRDCHRIAFAGDIKADFGDIVGEAYGTITWSDRSYPLSRPVCQLCHTPPTDNLLEVTGGLLRTPL